MATKQSDGKKRAAKYEWNDDEDKKLIKLKNEDGLKGKGLQEAMGLPACKESGKILQNRWTTINPDKDKDDARTKAKEPWSDKEHTRLAQLQLEYGDTA